MTSNLINCNPLQSLQSCTLSLNYCYSLHLFEDNTFWSRFTTLIFCLIFCWRGGGREGGRRGDLKGENLLKVKSHTSHKTPTQPELNPVSVVKGTRSIAYPPSLPLEGILVHCKVPPG